MRATWMPNAGRTHSLGPLLPTRTQSVHHEWYTNKLPTIDSGTKDHIMDPRKIPLVRETM